MTIDRLNPAALPNPEQVQQALQGLSEDIWAQGGARRTLNTLRVQRKHSQIFNGFLHIAAGYGMLFEDRDGDGRLVDKEHKIANAVLTGMIFGELLNQRIHPTVDSHRPVIALDLSDIGDPQLTEAVKRAGGPKTLASLRISLRYASVLAMESLTDESKMALQELSVATIGDMEYRPSFLLGTGIELFAGRSYHEKQNKIYHDMVRAHLRKTRPNDEGVSTD